MPINDWQFWIVTAICLAAALWLSRSILKFGSSKKTVRTKVKLTINNSEHTKPKPKPKPNPNHE